MLDLLSYLTKHNIEVMRDDGNELACLCPFHNNTDTPAFYINKNTGLWICFNPSCGRKGSLSELMAFFGDAKPPSNDYSCDQIQKMLAIEPEYEHQKQDWAAALSSIKLAFPEQAHLARYLIDRGFTSETLGFFEIGYSSKRNRLVIPVRDEMSNLVGFIGRSTDPNVTPKYLYSKGMPRKSVLFNLNHAKKFDTVVVTEGSLDAMMVHQAGHHGVVATLGAAVTDQHVELLRKHFDTIIVFSDNDSAGLAMRDIILNKIFDKSVKVVQYPPGDFKDPGDLSSAQILKCIQEATDWLAASLALNAHGDVV